LSSQSSSCFTEDFRILKGKARGDRVAQVVKCLLSKCGALSLSPSTAKNKKEEEKESKASNSLFFLLLL
jgi:hypothetical protein